MGPSARILVLVNPAAGAGRARRAQRNVAAYFRGQGASADFLETRSLDDLRRCAREGAESEYAAIAVLGGDGTFKHVAEATLGHRVVLGLLPAGGGNDVAQGLGLPNDPVAAARVFLHSRPRPVDVLQARTRNGGTGIYLGGGGLGLDAEAAQLANRRFRRFSGAARYVACALTALSRFQPFHLDLELDGSPVPQRCGPLLLAAVVNTPTYGAGILIAPAACMADGLLDVAFMSAVPWTRLLELIPEMLRTGHVGESVLRRSRARRVLFRPDRPMVFHGDGELIGEAPVEVKVLEGAIQVAAPA